MMASELNDKDRLVLRIIGDSCEKKGQDNVKFEEIAERLDPPRRIELYLRLHEDYVKSAEELYARGDLARAGVKYWGAVTALLNIVGEKLNMPHYSHRDLREIISYLLNRNEQRS